MVWSSRCRVNLAAFATFVSFTTSILRNTHRLVRNLDNDLKQQCMQFNEVALTLERPPAQRSAHICRVHLSCCGSGESAPRLPLGCGVWTISRSNG